MQAYGCKALDNIGRLDFEADLYKRSPPYRIHCIATPSAISKNHRGELFPPEEECSCLTFN
jgi:hypothetical protein